MKTYDFYVPASSDEPLQISSDTVLTGVHYIKDGMTEVLALQKHNGPTPFVVVKGVVVEKLPDEKGCRHFVLDAEPLRDKSFQERVERALAGLGVRCPVNFFSTEELEARIY